MKKEYCKKCVKSVLAAAMAVTVAVTSAPFTLQNVNAEENKGVQSNTVIPKPVEYYAEEGVFTLDRSTEIYVQGKDADDTAELLNTAEYLAEIFRPSTGYVLPIKEGVPEGSGQIVITTEAEGSLGEEGYDLHVEADGVTISANEPAGAFWGIQTFRQLFPAEIEKDEIVEDTEWEAQSCSIIDTPEYEYRGTMLDVSRHFFTVDEVKRHIDNISQYKINKLHLHLSDDQGWRLEIKGEMYGESLSKLLTVGAASSASMNGKKAGYYTQEDFKEIVDYAAKHYVEIIPEFDMPSHSWAALVSLNFLNSTEDGKPHSGNYDNTKPYEGIDVGFSTFECRNEKTYEFIDEVFKQVAAISPSRYIHVGGDEAHSTTDEDYAYFCNRVTEIAQKYGKIPIGWQNYDSVVENTENTVTQYWLTDGSQYKPGIKYIASPANYAYIDMKYDSSCELGLQWAALISIQRAYEWDPTDYGSKDQVIGIECPLWSETLTSTDGIDYMAFPRLMGHAEIGWTSKENRGWEEYKTRLAAQGERLENKGINYYKDESIWEVPYEPVNAEWDMDEGEGNSISDKNNKYSGQLSEGVSWTEGVSGNGLAFDGKSGYVELGIGDLKGPWTASMWVNKAHMETTNAVLLSGSEGEIKLEQWKNTRKVGITKFGDADHTFEYEAPEGEWVHLTFVSDGTSTSLYVNGTLKETLDVTINCPAKRIGANDKAGLADAGYLKAVLDEVKIFNRALTNEEVAELYTAPAKPQPVMKVTFDDGTASDVTGRGNNGTVYGSPEFVEGVSGQAVHLVNPEDAAGQPPVAAQQYIDFGTPEDLRFGEDDFSIVFWYKSERPADRNHKEGAIVSNKNWNSGQNEGFNIGDMRQGINLNFNTDASQKRRETDRFAEAVDGQWHHIAAAIDRDGSMVLYVDGEKPTQGAGFGSSKSAEIDITDRSGTIDSLNFVVGADGKKELGVLDIYLDELAVYKEALTQEQVRELCGIEAPPEDQPVLYVSFDNSDAADESGRGNDGAVMGTPEFAAGIKGNAIHLTNPEGVADSTTVEAEQYVNFGKPRDLQFGTEDFSIMFWYKSDGSDPAEVSVISNKNWNTGSNPGFTIGDMRNGLTLNFTGQGQSRQDTGRISAATDNTWHHIAATYNRSGNMVLYVDGKNYATVNISRQKGAGIDMYDLVLGADGMKRQGVTDSWIDELYIYRSVLSEEQIKNYNAPFVLQNLIAEYEALLETSDASQEKKEAFSTEISAVKEEAAGTEDLQRIEELTTRLKAAYDSFMSPEDGIITFEVVSDVHVASSNPNHNNAVQFRDMLSDVQKSYPDTSVILNCGDFTENGSEEQASVYFDILNEYSQFDFMTALGNHDVRWRSGWDEIKERYLRLNGKYMGENEGKVYFDRWIDGYHFIVLNTEWDIKDRAYISPEQLEWLDSVMAEGAEEGKPIFVVMHQPLNDTFNMSDVYPLGKQDFALKEVLRRYPQTILFTGHVHNGMGELEIMRTDYGTLVDVPSMRSNNQGDSQGQIAYHVTVYEDKIQLNLRDYRDNEWIAENTYTIPLDVSSYPVGKVLDVTFDEGDVSDQSGFENHGAVVGDVEFSEGFNGGKAIHIVNSEEAEQYVDFGNIAGLNFGKDDYTVMFQYKTDNSSEGSIIGSKGAGDESSGFAIRSIADQGLVLEYGGWNGTLVETDPSGSEYDGKWHAVTATVEHSGDMILYIDGKEVQRRTIGGVAEGNAEELNLILGADGLLKEGAQDVYIDNLKIYKSVLGPDEIESTWSPYKVSTSANSVTISWDIADEDEGIEPAYLVLNGEKKEIPSGKTEATLSGLTPGEEYTIMLVTHEKSHTNNFRDVYSFVVTIPEPEIDDISTAVLEYTLSLAERAKTDGVIDSVVDQFNAAKQQAQSILEKVQAKDTEVTQEMVDESWQSLLHVMQFLSFEKGEKSDLEKVITAAEAVDLERYLSAGQDTFRAALEQAKTVFDSGDAMQDEVDQAWKDLLKAMSELRIKPDKSALEDLIGYAEKLGIEGCSEELTGRFRAAFAAAKAVFENGEAEAEDVNSAAETLRTVIAEVSEVTGSAGLNDKTDSGERGNNSTLQKEGDNLSASASETDTKSETDNGSETNGGNGKSGSLSEAGRAVKTGDSVNLMLLLAGAVLTAVIGVTAYKLQRKES